MGEVVPGAHDVVGWNALVALYLRIDGQVLLMLRPEFLPELNEVARPQCVSGDGRVVGLATGR